MLMIWNPETKEPSLVNRIVYRQLVSEGWLTEKPQNPTIKQQEKLNGKSSEKGQHTQDEKQPKQRKSAKQQQITDECRRAIESETGADV